MAAPDQTLSEKRTLNKSKILASGVFLALRDNMLFVRDIPDNRFDLSAKLPRCSQPPMSKHRLVAPAVVRMRANENRRVLPSLSDAAYELFERDIVLRQAIGDKKSSIRSGSIS